MGGGFKEFIIYLSIFAFLVTFWTNFKADMERRVGVRKYTNQIQKSNQVVKQKLYPSGYNVGPAAVYYQQY